MKQVNTQKQTKREQEDAALNRILIWFGAAVVAELIVLLINRILPGIALVRGLSTLIPAVAVLALIYYLYQHDFFLITLISAGGLAALYTYRKIVSAHPFRINCMFALAFVLLAAALIVLILLQRRGGAIAQGEKKQELLPKDTNYPLLYATCALNAVVLAVTIAMGSTLAYYLMFVLVAWLFVMAVYYTVRLI